MGFGGAKLNFRIKLKFIFSIFTKVELKISIWWKLFRRLFVGWRNAESKPVSWLCAHFRSHKNHYHYLFDSEIGAEGRGKEFPRLSRRHCPCRVNRFLPFVAYPALDGSGVIYWLGNQRCVSPPFWFRIAVDPLFKTIYLIWNHRRPNRQQRLVEMIWVLQNRRVHQIPMFLTPKFAADLTA